MIEHKKFEISYTITARDYAAMTSAITRRPLRKNLRTLVLLLFSVWCLIFFYTNVYNPIEMIATVASSIVSTLSFTALLIFLLAITVANTWLVRILSYSFYRHLASADATITMTMDETSIQSLSSVANTVIPWRTVKRVMREPDHLIVSISAREAFIFPRRSFESGEEFDAAILYAEDQVSRSRTLNSVPAE